MRKKSQRLGKKWQKGKENDEKRREEKGKESIEDRGYVLAVSVAKESRPVERRRRCERRKEKRE